MSTPQELEMELADRVSEGAAFMDAIDKGLPESERWYWVVDPDRLDMSQSTGGHRRECGCIIGQHHPEGFFYPDDYGIGEFGRANSESFRLGFDGGWEEYPLLTTLWINEINERRAAYFDRHPEAIIR